VNKNFESTPSSRAEPQADLSVDDLPMAAGELLREVLALRNELEMQNKNLRHSQAELGNARDLYEDLYNFSPIGYLSLDKDGLILQINLTGTAMLAGVGDELLNAYFVLFVAENNRHQWHRFFLNTLNSNLSQHFELDLQRVDGSIFVARMDCLSHDAGNGEHSVRIALTDISDQKLTENRLCESEAKLSAIFKGAIDGILLVDVMSKKFSFCNEAMCRMLGYSHEEITNLSVFDVHPSQDLPSIMEKLEKHVRGESSLAEKIPFKRRDGTVFLTDITSTSILLNDKLYLVGVIRDITERMQVEEALRVSTLKYQMLFESSRDALMILAPPFWKFTDANAATLGLFGVATVAEFTELGPWDISPHCQPDGQCSSEKAQQMIATAMRDGSNFFEWEHQKMNGQAFPTDVLLTRMELGEEVFVQATVRDISGRRQAERLLAQAQVITESEEKFRKITESAHDAIIMMGADKCISLWNTAAERIFGYTASEAIGCEMHPLLAPDACPAFEKGFLAFKKTGAGPVVGKMLELNALRKGGESFPVEVTISALQINGAWHALGIFRDITEHKLNEEKIRKLAFYDALTQLPNRRLLNDRLDQAMAASRRSERYGGALMFVDLDNFKPLNDNHGHGVGDLLLIEVAQRITSCLREMDTVARFGGDEFVVLLSELDVDKSTSVKQAYTVAEKIRATLAESYCMESAEGAVVEHRCTSSIGVVLFLNHQATADTILKCADMAMYQAKESGRNKVVFSSRHEV